MRMTKDIYLDILQELKSLLKETSVFSKSQQ